MNVSDYASELSVITDDVVEALFPPELTGTAEQKIYAFRGDRLETLQNPGQGYAGSEQ